MHRYVGVYCPVTDCGAFNVWGELQPGELAQARALQWVAGACMKCGREFSVSVEKSVEIESEDPPRAAASALDVG